jgi:acyl-CoA thioesterase
VSDGREAAEELARRSAAAMLERDAASRGLGMMVEDVRPGYARLRMLVREDMLNGHDTCHGGYVFMLADSAFAFACNSRDRTTVAAGAAIEFLAPGRAGDVFRGRSYGLNAPVIRGP